MVLASAAVDTELNGQPSIGAVADDTTGVDDEDGVTFGVIQVGQVDAVANVNVQLRLRAKLEAWIDFNGDGKLE